MGHSVPKTQARPTETVPLQAWPVNTWCPGLVPREWGALPHGLGRLPHAIRGAIAPEGADIGAGGTSRLGSERADGRADEPGT